MESPDTSTISTDASTEPTRRFGPWMPQFVAAGVAGTVAFVWCFVESPSGPEGLMGLANLLDCEMIAVPTAMGFGILALVLANKLVALAPKAPPWVVPPEETIDGHYKPAWLVAFALPFVVVPIFGLLPFAGLSWLVDHQNVAMHNGSGTGPFGATLGSLMLVPRLGGAVLRKVDVVVYARARKRGAA